MPRITVTRATTSQDVDLAMAVWRAGNRTWRRPAGPLRAGRVLERLRNAQVLLLARYGDDPAGMLMAEQFVIEHSVADHQDGHTSAALPDPDTGHVAMVFVHPSRWGSGIGRALLDELKTREWTRLSAWIRDDNKRALRLFLSAGFVDTGHRAHLQDGDVIQQVMWQRTE